MAYVRQANRFGKPSELPDTGYVTSGEDDHSRRSARGKMPTRFAGRVPRKRPGEHTLYQQIGETERQIEYLEVELKIADTKTEKDRIARSLVIKAKLLTRLRVEAEALR